MYPLSFFIPLFFVFSVSSLPFILFDFYIILLLFMLLLLTSFTPSIFNVRCFRFYSIYVYLSCVFFAFSPSISVTCFRFFSYTLFVQFLFSPAFSYSNLLPSFNYSSTFSLTVINFPDPGLHLLLST